MVGTTGLEPVTSYVVAFSIAMGNAERIGTQLDQLEQEEIEVPSESSFDFTFE